MHHYRRLPITLIEILIAIMIISLVGGIVGISITRALKEQRFRTEADLVIDTLRLAQNIMLILGTDVHFRVKTADNKMGIEYYLDVEGGGPEKWRRIIQRSHRLLKETHGVSFKDLQPFPVIPGQLDIRFQSNGAMMSKGVLHLSTHENEKDPGAMTMAICLKGYPHSISGTLVKGDDIQCDIHEDDDFNHRLTLSSIQEIKEDDELGNNIPPVNPVNDKNQNQGSKTKTKVKGDK